MRPTPSGGGHPRNAPVPVAENGELKVKKDWEIKKLNSVCTIRTGKHDANHAIENGKYRFYTCASQYLYCDTKSFSGECLILPGNGVNVGEVYYYKGDFDAYQRTYVISEIDKSVDSHFLYYNMLLNWKSVGAAKQYGSATNFIKIGNFNEYSFPVPPLEEQKRIVKILDEKFVQLETIKTNAQTNLQNAKDLFQSQLAKAFSNTTWEKKRLGDFCESFEYGTSKKSSADGKVPVLRMGNIKNGKLDFTDLVYSNDEDEIKKYLLSKGDVLFNRTNSPEWVGKTAVFEEDFPAIFAGYIIRVNYDKKIINPYYLNYWLNSKETMEYGFSVMTSSVHQANISGTKLAEYKIPLPPLPEQKRIVEELDTLSAKVRQLQEIYTKQIANCADLKQSLLQKAFEGEL